MNLSIHMNQSLRTQHFKSGDIIFREREYAECGYIIKSGRIEISVQKGNKRTVLAMFKEGEIFGEMAIIDETHRSATATCLEDCELYIVGKNELASRIRAADPIVKLLLHAISDRLRLDFRSISVHEEEENQAQVIELFAKKSHASAGDPDHDQALNKMQMEAKLRAALEAEAFEVYYQPIVEIATGQVLGCEALMRWNDPEEGFIPPDVFIPLAEETNLILPMGRWVFRQALKDIPKLEKQYETKRKKDNPFYVSVNVSAKQFYDIKFFHGLEEALNDLNVPANQLTLEITESALIDIEKAIPWIQHCKHLGIKLSLDDFGTGYSSLHYLSQIPIDTLKLDKVFINRAMTDPKTFLIAKTIIELSQNLGLDVVAEGIETPAQSELLRSMNCINGQGFLFGHPKPVIVSKKGKEKKVA
jgi:EAL domain-containing protein (putative c-di-GMP-specific phosphodiesterase class I)